MIYYMAIKKICKHLLSILFSTVIFGCVKYLFEREFNSSLIISAIITAIIFEVLLNISKIYFFTPERTNRWENSLKRLIRRILNQK